jgi:hypothetical protein
MGKSNQNQHAKRKRELAKKDKRDAKDKKRALTKEGARDARVEPSVEGRVAPLAPVPLTAQQRWAAPKPKPVVSRGSSVGAAAFVGRMKIVGK